MMTSRRFRVAGVLTMAGLAVPVFWLSRRLLSHSKSVTSVGVQPRYVWFFLASAALATLACVGAVGLAVPLLVRDPTLRTRTRVTASIAAALTGLVFAAFWVSAFFRAPGPMSYVLFVGLAPGITVVLTVRAARRFRAELPKRRAILALAIALLALWAVASTVNFFALWMDPETHGPVMSYLTLTYGAFGTGLVMAMGRPDARSWTLVIATAVVYVAIFVLSVAVAA
jgi:hypothetical protein